MKTIGRYEIRGLLGKGGMSRVYRVKLPVIGKIAALKRLEPDPMLVELLGMDRLRALFMAEARILAAIRHPQVVEIRAFEEIDGRPCYLMDYFCNSLGVLMGESHRTETPSRILPAERAIHYLRQVLQGLACLHHEGIIHRDVKPYNVLITDQDTVKLCDFGLSKLRGEKTAGPPNLKVGSPWYAAPEQEREPDAVDPRADLYSAGVMLYRMLTGRLPQAGGDRPSIVNPELDHAWDDFTARATAASPAQRFTDAASMLEALQDLERHWRAQRELACRLAPPASEPAAPPPVPSSIPRRAALKTDLRRARGVFGLDRLWRPLRWAAGRWAPAGDGRVVDRVAGLTWQSAGSAYPLTWPAARRYVERLNAERCAGFADWRLPTVDELLTLLARRPQGLDHCLEPIFDPTQQRLWSIDRKSYGAAWYVNTLLGFVDWQDDSCLNYTRAVRSDPLQAPAAPVGPTSLAGPR